MAVVGSTAYIADDYGSGLRILDVSNPAAPTEVGFYSTGDLYRVAVSDGYVYAAAQSGGLFILQYLPYSIYLPMVVRNR